ncbi:amino acid ABC transporter permease [Bosea caraganae]|uniref:Amino acid ABC transporter permease n=1 Tax=Bosea caraganae TaxID=2763117 RepID=A0A370L233_9HYPH|nr:amino acid ABC transporter permease [Bosea caraganae]RDJ22187.1 amino acid ABC transporter permease [Bosea caraganae]RDJ22726.1 amino acid ABC transporter permease [Bosea caraganae]
MDGSFDFNSVFAASDQLLLGAGLTLQLTVEAVVLGMIVAVVGAWAKTSGPNWAKSVVNVYVEVIRNTPFLLQLYFFFFGLPALGFRLTPNQAALLTMVINLGAYATEIVRAGIEAIPHGQTEAGKALGFRPLQIFRLIILPPALRIIYQPLAGQFTMVLLGSSVVSAISANELTSVANSIQAANFKTFETYLVVSFMYLLMVLAFRALFNAIYTRSFGSDGQVQRVPGL